jgi:hypothetical protein
MSDSVTWDEIVYPVGWEAYGGQWVALRNGAIIAGARKLADLYADERVQRGDEIWRVPEPGVHHIYASHAAA